MIEYHIRAGEPVGHLKDRHRQGANIHVDYKLFPVKIL